MIESLYIIVGAVGASLLYSISFLVAKLLKGEQYEPSKMVATAIVGVFVGLYLVAQNIAVSEQIWTINFMQSLAMIPIVEKWVKAAWRKYKQK